jgi:hypothetical protein
LAAPLALYRANMSWSACWKQRRKWLFIAGKPACYSYLGSCGIFFATSLKPSEGKGQLFRLWFDACQQKPFLKIC